MLSSEETVQAKHAFERYTDLHNMSVKHYHADNAQFVDNLFIAVKDKP